MKNYYLYLTSLLLFVSCNTSESVEVSKMNTLAKLELEGNELPYNPINSFDYTGQIHNEVLLTYFDQPMRPKSIDSILSIIQLNVNEYSLINPNVSISSDEIQVLVTNPEIALDSFLSSSLLSESSKNNLEDFISSVIIQLNEDVNYEALYEHIIEYESTVAANIYFTANEKEIILSITSIIRHSTYMRKKKPKKNLDMDWDWLTTNIVGTAAGSSGDVSKAITVALVAGIIDNQ